MYGLAVSDEEEALLGSSLYFLKLSLDDDFKDCLESAFKLVFEKLANLKERRSRSSSASPGEAISRSIVVGLVSRSGSDTMGESNGLISSVSLSKVLSKLTDDGLSIVRTGASVRTFLLSMAISSRYVFEKQQENSKGYNIKIRQLRGLGVEKPSLCRRAARNFHNSRAVCQFYPVSKNLLQLYQGQERISVLSGNTVHIHHQNKNKHTIEVNQEKNQKQLLLLCKRH